MILEDWELVCGGLLFAMIWALFGLSQIEPTLGFPVFIILLLCYIDAYGKLRKESDKKLFNINERKNKNDY